MEIVLAAKTSSLQPTELLTIAVAPSDMPDLRLLDGWDPDHKGKAPSGLRLLAQQTAAAERFEGKLGQSLSFAFPVGTGPSKRILLLGAGAPAVKGEATRPSQVERAQFVAARAAKAAQQVGAKTMTLSLDALGLGKERHAEALVEAITKGLLLGAYRFTKYQAKAQPWVVERCTLHVAAKNRALAQAVERGQVIARAIARTRDWVNEPPSEMTPSRLAQEAKQLAKAHGAQGLAAKVLDRAACEKLGMGMFLAVGRGSDEMPQFIHLTYTPKTKRPKGRIALIGKGVTFDSGGLSLKPSDSMVTMKMDMAGAAAVISVMGAVAELGLPLEVHGLAACAENMPSGKAYKLGDVLRSMDGKTVEINNTDAEGRLTLGDAITYARKLEVDEIVDVATLTGACMVALGPHMAGVMSNSDELRDRVTAAARRAGEDVWALPLPDRLKDQLKSEVADMRNTGDRLGGALTAGLFLSEFAGETPWAHIDLAGPAFADKEWGHIGKGGTGFGVATLLSYLAG